MKKRIVAILIFIIGVGLLAKPAKDYFQEVAEKKAKSEQETATQKAKIEQEIAAKKAKVEQEELMKSKNKSQIDDSITRAKQALYSSELTKQTIVSDLIDKTMSDTNAFRVAIEQAIQADFNRTKQQLQGTADVKTSELQLEITKTIVAEKQGHLTAYDSKKRQLDLQHKISTLQLDVLKEEAKELGEKAKKEAAISDISNRLLPLQKMVATYIEFQKPLSIKNQDGTEQLFQIGIILVDKLPETKNLYLSEIEVARQNIKKVNEIKLSDSTFRTLSFNNDDFIIYKDDIDYMVERLIEFNKEAESFYQSLLEFLKNHNQKSSYTIEPTNELDEANNRINVVWQGTTKAIRKALLPEQRAWLKKRERDCSGQDDKIHCMAEMTDQRTEELKQKIALMEGM